MITYLDNAATTYPKPKTVINAVNHFASSVGGNSGRGGHRLSQKTGELMYACRENLGELFNIDNPERIVFTKNATESLNLALSGVLNRNDHVCVSPFEHNAVMRPLKHLGVSYSIVGEHEVNPVGFMRYIRPNTRMICCTHCSNVSGQIFPIEDIGKLCRMRGILFLVDAAQSAGCMNVDAKKMKIDLLAFPGHKGLFGFQGTGGLYVAENINIRPLIVGGTGSMSESLEQPKFLPDALESGTLNAHGLIGLSKGVEYVIDRGVESILTHERMLARRFWDIVSQRRGVGLVGHFDRPQTGVVSLDIPTHDIVALASELDNTYNIAVRGGLHCAIMAHKSYKTAQTGTLRFSFGLFNTKSDSDFAAKALIKTLEDNH